MFTVVTSEDNDTPVKDRVNSVKGGSMQVDPQQMASFAKILELLISAGYFRAMITTLDPFDKVAGGLAWCITAANENVNLGLLFEEHGRQGEKVEMSENIEYALVSMKCPHVVQATQILYLDCINIFPVVQWLVQHLIEVRKLTGDLVRVYSERQFSRFQFAVPGEEEAVEEEQKRKESLGDAIKRVQKLKKKARRATRNNPEFEEERVHAVLLEYGQAHLYTLAFLQKKKEYKPKVKGMKIAGAEQDEEERQRQAALAAEERGKKILRAMGVVGDEEGTVTSNSLNSMMQADAAGVEDARAKAAAEQEEADRLKQQANKKGQGEFDHQRLMVKIQKNMARCDARVEELKSLSQKKREELQAVKEQFEKKLAFNQRVIDETAKMTDTEMTPEGKHNLEILRSMFAMREDLKNQVEYFKVNVKGQRATWENRIKEIKGSVPDDAYNETLQVWEKDMEKLEKAREHAAAKNRAVAAIKRKIDSIPSRRELQQYQKQFVEVYEQMAVKFTETKQYFNLYNSGILVKEQLENEKRMLDEISTGFNQCKGTKRGREKFAVAIANMVEELQKEAQKKKDNYNKCILERNKLDEQFVVLNDKEREYYQVAKQFQDECKKNEELELKKQKLFPDESAKEAKKKQASGKS